MRRPRSLIIASHIVDNWRHKLRLRRGNLQASEGATHRNWALSKSLGYIDLVFREYLMYAGLAEADLAEKAVLEVGPGDNLGVALKFIAAGASRVVCLDRIYSFRDSSREEAIYRAIRETLTASQRARFDDAIDLSHGIALNPDRLRYFFGVGIEEASTALPRGAFDLIVSRAVLMEIQADDMGLAAMDQVLRGGGLMIHKFAPCQDYGMFTANGYGPLEYLTVPGWLYRLMTRDSGKPNRRLMGAYRQAVAELGYWPEFHIVGVIGVSGREFSPGTFKLERGIHYGEDAVALVRDARRRLCREFRDLPDEELIVAGAFLVARKPADVSSNDDGQESGESTAKTAPGRA